MMCNLFQAKFTLFLCCLVQLTRLSQAAEECPGSATYTLTFNAEWSSSTHPKAFVRSAHFSPMVVCTHNSSYVMWKPDQMATPGVKEVAETGATRTINSEIDEQIRRKAASAKFEGRSISSPGDDKINDIQVSTQYPLISAITMIAPSPDWFVGIHDVNFCNKTTGKWLDKYEKDLFPYDAGTDSGLTFVSGNMVTDPRGVIALIKNTEEGSFKSNDPIKKLGNFTFEKTSESIPNLQSSTSSPTISQTSASVVNSVTTPTGSTTNDARSSVYPSLSSTLLKFTMSFSLFIVIHAF